MHPSARIPPLFSLAILLLGLPACSREAANSPVYGPTASSSPLLRGTAPGNAPPGSSDAAGRADPAAADALLPDRIRLHPLTRLTRAADGSLQIACHVELRDRFAHACKGLGRLRVELYRPGPDAASGGETQELVWNIDLRDPDANALVYDDLVTRTYVVYLGGLPEWVQQLAAAKSREPWLTLQAYFTLTNSRGRDIMLQTTYRLTR